MSVTRGEHRSEIQGLRAVAALLVATYHIWFGRVSGGVDVFIVVSAFLITTSLLRQVEGSGRIDFAGFWGGLVRRLVPAAFLVLGAVTLAAILWLPRQRWIDTIGEVVASALYVENWLLAFRSVDYLAPSARSSPVQHFWALSVQGQLYVVWPLLFAVVLGAAGLLRARVRAVAFVGVAAIFALSLAYSVVRTEANQPFTYFDTFARAWEFSLGALFAVALPWLRLAPWQRVTAGWIGLIGVLSCGIVLQVSRVFPGNAALWPTLSAMLILVAHGSGSRFGADRLLSWRPLTFLGDQSYSIYLWHWPVFVFYRLATGRDAVGLPEGLGIIAASIVIATVATRLVETPIRRPRAGALPARALAVARLSFAPLGLILAAWAAYAFHMKRVDGRILAPDDPMYPGAAVMASGATTAVEPDVPVHPGPMAVKADRPAMLQGDCFQNMHDSEPVSCVYGDSSAARVMAVVGSSYVAHWVPALERFALDEGWRIVTYTKNRCSLSTETRMIAGEPYLSCSEWNQRVMDRLLSERPAVVFTRATMGTGISESVRPGFVDQWRQLTAAGIEVIAIRNTPRFPFDVADCVARHGPDDEECGMDRDSALAAVDPTDHWQGRLPGVHFIDLSRFFCDSAACPPVIGNLLVYADDGHITTHYARTLVPMLKRELLRITSSLVRMRTPRLD